jgi:signal peptidase I
VVLGFAREAVLVVAKALALSLLVKTFLVQPFIIPSESMQDTLLVHDRVLVTKLVPGPLDLHRGDVVVFQDPGGWLDPASRTVQRGAVAQGLHDALTFVGLVPEDSTQHLIKRVIGMPGDTVSCCDTQGRLQINGVSVTEPYVRAGSAPSACTFSQQVRANHVWVMGDNRGNSKDSRFHGELDHGQVPITAIVGKAFSIIWPFSRIGGVVEPDGVFDQVPDRDPDTETTGQADAADQAAPAQAAPAGTNTLLRPCTG